MPLDPIGGVARAPRWTLLVQDDDAAHLCALQGIADSEPVRLIPALTPEDALRVARTCHIDGVVVHEPEADSAATTQLVRLLRRLPHGERMPIVVAARGGPSALTFVAESAPRLHWRLDLAGLRAMAAAMDTAWNRATVLVIHEDGSRQRMLAELLARAGLEPRVAPPGMALRALESIKPDVALVGGDDAVNTVRQIRSSPRWRLQAIVAAVPAELAPVALRAGAGGVVDIDGPGDEIVEQVDAHIGRARLAAEHEQRDPLTGLLRPRAFLQWIADRLDTEGTREPLALTLFKLHVHSPSAILQERVLAAMALRLRQGHEHGTLWCRMGVRELAAAGRAEDRAGVLAAIASAAAAVERDLLSDRPSVRATLEVTIGAATAPDDGKSVETLLLAADRRLSGAT